MEPANRSPVPGAGFVPLPRLHPSRAKKLLSAAGNPVQPREGWRTRLYLVRPVAPSHPSGSPMLIAMDSNLCESGVLSETANRRMSSYMPGPLTDKPDGTTQHAHVANIYIPAGELPSKAPILLQVLGHLWPPGLFAGVLTSQLNVGKLEVVP